MPSEFINKIQQIIQRDIEKGNFKTVSGQADYAAIHNIHLKLAEIAILERIANSLENIVAITTAQPQIDRDRKRKKPLMEPDSVDGIPAELDRPTFT